MADGIGGPKLGDGGRPPRYSDNSSVTTSPTNSSNSSVRQIRNGDYQQPKRQPRCRNCNGPHGSWECPSRECFYPDCNAPNFASAEERQQHSCGERRRRPQPPRRRSRPRQRSRKRTQRRPWTPRQRRRTTSTRGTRRIGTGVLGGTRQSSPHGYVVRFDRPRLRPKLPR